ncbi:hypothetical protein NBRC116583_39240 [Arenicella sp. 4NH20-0111]|uniref:hypothetical protein n=1 Tax=Arenicella sp. 4NH20-0111 TaxID=3127648 RepID=UPI003106F3D9
MNKFGRAFLESFSEEQREIKLEELKSILEGRLLKALSHKDFFDETYRIIDGLKSVGHDLWSWGYDGSSKELWGGDYMKPSEMGQLKIEFIFPGQVNVFLGEKGGRRVNA